MFGLSDNDIRYLRQTLFSHIEITEAKIFGSRALGTYRKGSDIDIAIYGDAISLATVSSVRSQLEELSPLPYFFDIVDATHLAHEGLRDHIERIGITFYPEPEEGAGLIFEAVEIEVPVRTGESLLP